MPLIEIVANVATVLTIISFLTGTLICRNIYQKGSTNEFSSLPFVIGVLCGFLWLRYGLLLGDPTMILVNTIGLFLQSLYLTWFYVFTPHKAQINRRVMLLCSVLFAIHLYTRYALQPETLVGLMACMSSLIFCAAPLTAVSEVVRTKCTEKLPFSLIASSFLVCSMWFVYGYLIEDTFVQIPNGIGAIISGVQLSLFLVYPSKRSIETVNAVRRVKYCVDKDSSIEEVDHDDLLDHYDDHNHEDKAHLLKPWNTVVL